MLQYMLVVVQLEQTKLKYLHDPGQMEAGDDCKDAVNPPQHPGEDGHALTPGRHADQYDHVDERSKPHWKRREKQTLMRMAEHGGK